jgi:hypothetical protein
MKSYPSGATSALLESEPEPSMAGPHQGSLILTRAPTAFGEDVGDSVKTTVLVGVRVGVREAVGVMSDGDADGLREFRGEHDTDGDTRADADDAVVGSSVGATDVPTVAVDVWLRVELAEAAAELLGESLDVGSGDGERLDQVDSEADAELVGAASTVVVAVGASDAETAVAVGRNGDGTFVVDAALDAVTRIVSDSRMLKVGVTALSDDSE